MGRPAAKDWVVNLVRLICGDDDDGIVEEVDEVEDEEEVGLWCCSFSVFRRRFLSCGSSGGSRRRRISKIPASPLRRWA